MRRSRLRSTLLVTTVWLVTAVPIETALACSVCFGDPNSDMTKGAKAGVLVLLGVVAVVLAAFGSLAIFWMRRAANLENLDAAAEEARAVCVTAAHHNGFSA